MDWETLSFVKSSKRRKAILLTLDTPSTPSEIADKIGVSVSHVSRTLAEFVEKGIIECLTPDAKIGRLYERTKTGNEIVKYLEKTK